MYWNKAYYTWSSHVAHKYITKNIIALCFKTKHHFTSYYSSRCCTMLYHASESCTRINHVTQIFTNFYYISRYNNKLDHLVKCCTTLLLGALCCTKLQYNVHYTLTLWLDRPLKHFWFLDTHYYRPTNQPTNRPTDIAMYRAAIAAKNGDMNEL